MKTFATFIIVLSSALAFADQPIVVAPEKVDCAVKIDGTTHKNFEYDSNLEYLVSRVGDIEVSIVPMQTKGTVAVGATISDEVDNILSGPTLTDMQSPIDGPDKIVAMLKTPKHRVTVFCSLK